MKITLCKDFEFEAAQALPSFPEGHKCRGMHGHSFKLTVSVTGEVDPKTGILYDHARISEAMAPLLAQLDHACLNDIAGLEIPSIENICHWIWTRLAPQLPGLSELVLHETSRSRCVYRGD
ncbi:MAG TPA: 6-carboxytetrahydropterin synthase [Candidatus Methylacidiphilales bacterium]